MLRSWWVLGAMLVAGVAVPACKHKGTTGPNGNEGAISLGLSPGSATVEQGASTTVNGTLTRSGGFSGTVSLSVEVENAPSGVSATVGNIQTTGGTTTATITIDVALSAPVGGPHTVTVRATGSGVSDATATFQLTITAAPVPSFSLALSPAAINLIQTLKDSLTVTINRTNFAATVDLNAENLPSGVSAVFTPASTTGTTSKLVLTATGDAVPGNYPVTVRGSSPSSAVASLRTRDGPAAIADQTAPLDLSISAANLTLDFRACPVEARPIWVAAQDGTAAWVRVALSASGVYRVHYTQSKGGFAYVTIGGGLFSLKQSARILADRFGQLHANDVAEGHTTSIQFGSRDELIALTQALCPAEPSTKIVNGSVTGVDPSEFVFLNMGGSTDPLSGSGPFQLRTVAPGLQDFIAYKRPFAVGGIADRMFILRDQDFADGATMPTIDMTTQSFTPDNRQVSVLNSGTDVLFHGLDYLTGSCKSATLYSTTPVQAGLTTFFAYGPQPFRQRATDFHQVRIEALTAGDGSGNRFLEQTFHTLSTQSSFRFGDPLPVPVITSQAGNYKRLSATVTVPADYTALPQTTDFLWFAYVGDGPEFNVVSIHASLSWLGGAAAMVGMPAFSGLPEWIDAWVPPASAPVSWILQASYATSTNPCVEGRKSLTASRSGTI